jgi:hypothetical protein
VCLRRAWRACSLWDLAGGLVHFGQTSSEAVDPDSMLSRSGGFSEAAKT